MMAITVKFLGGLRQEMGMEFTTLQLQDDATVADLEQHLRSLGIDLDEQKNIAIINQRGLNQWPPDRHLVPDDVVMVFPIISGGS